MFDRLTVVFAHVVNFYLAPDKPEDDGSPESKGSPELTAWQKKYDLQQTVAKISAGSDPTSIAILEGYVREALRALIQQTYFPGN